MQIEKCAFMDAMEVHFRIRFEFFKKVPSKVFDIRRRCY